MCAYGVPCVDGDIALPVLFLCLFSGEGLKMALLVVVSVASCSYSLQCSVDDLHSCHFLLDGVINCVLFHQPLGVVRDRRCPLGSQLFLVTS